MRGEESLIRNEALKRVAITFEAERTESTDWSLRVVEGQLEKKGRCNLV